jgi:hypothetical protein
VLSSSSFNLAAAYDLSAFTRAQPVQTPWKDRGAPLGSQSPTVPRVPGNVARVPSLDALPDSVTLKTKILIMQGRDPEELGPIDRTRDVLRVCKELILAGVDDATIYAILLDEAYDISISVRNKGASKERYVLRQIERAREQAISPHLLRFNDRFSVIENYGGRCRVIEEQPDLAFNGRPVLTFQSFDDFCNRWMHMKVPCGTDKRGNPLEVPLGKWWLDQPARRQYTSITFSPGREIEGAYNLWRGFAVEPRPGTKHLRFLEHVREGLCNGDEEIYTYLLSWMARAVQLPNVPGEVAIVLRGRKGTGKGKFAKTFGALFGRHFWQVSDARHIVGNFNAHLRDCVMLFGDEAFWAGDKKHESVLKALITEDTFVVERKGFDAEAASNYVHLIMASNEQWVVPASQDERRFLVLDVAPIHMQNTAYFGAIDIDMKSGGLSNLLHALQSLDISAFDHRTVPQTDALQDQKIHSLAPHEEFWFRRLCDGIIRPTHSSWTAPVQKDALIEDYLTYAQKIGGNKRVSATTFARALERWSPGLEMFQADLRGRDRNGDPRIGRDNFWKFPELSLCRETFERQCGGPFRWPKISVHDHAAGDPF